MRQDICKLTEQALALVKSGDLPAAMGICEQICLMDKDNADAWMMLGGIHMQSGGLAKAEACYRRTVVLQPGFAEAYFELGEALQAQNKTEEAIAAYRETLRCKPDFMEGHNRLGMLLHSLKRLDEAQESYQLALRLFPDQAATHYNLGVVLQEKQSYEEAERSYRQAVRIRPKYAKAHANLGYVLRLQHKLDEAVACYQQALRVVPASAVVHYNLGLVLEESGRPDEALQCYKNAIKIKPDYTEAYIRLAVMHQHRGNYDDAVAYFQQALRIQPDNAESHYGQATTLVLQGKQDQAVACYQQALRINPDHVDAHVGLGAALMPLGMPNEAMACCEQAMRIQPGHINATTLAANIAIQLGNRNKAYDLLSPLLDAGIEHANVALAFGEICGSVGREREAIVMLKKLLTERPMLTASAKCNLHFSLGKLYDATGNYDQAFDQYRQGNETKCLSFDAVRHTREVDSIVALHTADFMARMPRSSIRSDRPVFIVGMVRSGTSLVEQILASHPSVHGAGELPDITQTALLLHSMFGTDLHYPRCMPLLTRDKLDMIARQYLGHLAELAPDDAVRVIDKMPGNFMYLGLIELLFPGARVIHCGRDPMDTCLSTYFQDFSRSHPYSYDLYNLGAYYKEYRNVMRHWKNVLRIPILDVQYEDLIDNQELMSRKLLEFCGLEWDDRCLQFHETKRFIGTASHDQVRRPLYKKSVARWKNYEEYLGPLKEALGSLALTHNPKSTRGGS